ncbi:hypothetical protein BGZ49_001277 [Haplosporangium sp. Z 27]|nr:hypothetical protein BGZ49_001277 [Haplosporangium sp. Z 27]
MKNAESRTDKLAFESPFTPQDWGNYARQEEMNSRLNNNTTRGTGSGRFLPRPPPKEISTIVEPATRFRSSPPISSPATASSSSPVSRPVSNAVSPPTTISRSATLSTPVSSPSRSTSSTDSTRANTLQKPGTKSLYIDYDSDSLPKNQSASSDPSSRPTTPKEPSSFDTLTISNLIDIGSDSEENNTSSQSLVPYGAVSSLEKSTKLPCAPSTLADLLDIDFTIGADISVDKSLDITASSSGSSNDLWDSFQPTVTAPNKNNDLISLLDSQDYTHISQNQLDLSKPLEPTFKHNVKIETNNGYQDLLGDICNGTSDKVQDRTEEEDNDDDDDDDDDSSDSDDDSNSDSYSDSNSDIDSEDEDGFNGLWYAVDGKIILKLSTLDEIKAELENAGINDYSDADLYNK